jgi:hypothetical protein
MSNLRGNLQYCFTPLVGYIMDTPEQSLLACISPKVSPMSTAIYKQFGDNKHHPPHTAALTLTNIHTACIQADPTDFLDFLKEVKAHHLNGVHEPFWNT